MNAVCQRGNGNSQGYRILRNIQKRCKFFFFIVARMMRPQVLNMQFEDIRQSVTYCYLKPYKGIIVLVKVRNNSVHIEAILS
jgi:hypothetical protein